jgi:hypothetical protein
LVSDLVSPDLSRPTGAVSVASALALPPLSLGLREGLSREVTLYVGPPDQRDRKYARRRRAKGLVVHHKKTRGEWPRWHRVATCGRAYSGDVEIMHRDGRCWPKGVFQCGAIWMCPVCSARIRSYRAAEIQTGAATWVAGGGRLAMVTLTVRHDRSMPLSDVLGAVLSSWRKLQSQKAYRVLRKNLSGTIKSLEITYGENGWHPHLHVLLFVNRDLSEVEVQRAGLALADGWRKLVSAELGAVPSIERAVDFRYLDQSAAAYIAKIGKEISSADTKSGRDPFALLDVEGEGRDEAVARFYEYGEAIFGCQATTWSSQLRALLGLAELESNFGNQIVEIAELEDMQALVFGVVSKDDWNVMWKDGTIAAFLRSCESKLSRGP